jgi:hypothetical protein
MMNESSYKGVLERGGEGGDKIKLVESRHPETRM